MRRLHAWLAIVLAVPLICWSVTGLLFHLKPGWARAYEQLSVERDGRLSAAQLAPLPPTLTFDHAELFDTALGPLYRVHQGAVTTLLDAHTARVRSPLGIDDARLLAVDAVSRSRSAADYGAPDSATVGDDVIHVAFAAGRIVDVGRSDASVTQHGADTARIDALYRLHYLQWTGIKTIDRILAVAGLGLIWATVVFGLYLFVTTRRRKS